MTQIDLPEEYVPIKRLLFCSNELIDVTVPIVVGTGAPLLIGRGDPVAIWLYKPIGSPDSSYWEPLIENNKPLVNEVQLLTHKEGSGVVILDDERILQYADATNESVTLIKLDLRTFGLAIFGDAQGLWVGGSTLVGNHFKGLYSMIGIADKA